MTARGASRSPVWRRRAAEAAGVAPVTHGEAVLRLLRGARGGMVTGRLIETALKGLGADPCAADRPHVLFNAVSFARRGLRPGESIEVVIGHGYRLTGPSP